MSANPSARRDILVAANRHILAGRRSQPLNARQINQAVCIVRQWGLVKPEVLTAAGFNATSSRKAPVRTLVLTAKQRREIVVGEHPDGVVSGADDPPRPVRRSWFGRKAKS